MTSALPATLQIFFLVMGLAVGSFLNVLSLRALSGESIILPPSHCPKCDHRLSVLDNIPLFSYLLLGGKCRYCQGAISLQYPLVEALTAVMFLSFLNTFGLTWYCAGMVVFGCTLITVCVTDIKEKLIPHDITYPSMLLGIVFSALVRQDALGAMAGIGASYILFDFLAHYGLKIYLAMQVSDKSASCPAYESSDETIDESFCLDETEDATQVSDDFEVMGGGDAVLSAVIAAWLGWQRLVVAIFVGFLVGTVVGMTILIKDMKEAGLLLECVRPALLGSLMGLALLAVPMLLLSNYTGQQLPWAAFGGLGAVGGCLLGLVSVGTRVSKPFPFGPALATGGFVAIFWDPIGLLFKGGA